METITKKKTKIDIDYVPMFNKLLSPFYEEYDKDQIIRDFYRKYHLENSVGFMYELYLKSNGKTDNLVTSTEELSEFVEDACDLIMAVFFKRMEEAENE